MRYPILFVFWPQNEEIDVSSENGHLLLEYLNNGGFLYMIGCQSRLHAFIQGLFQEELRGNAGGITLERLQRSDRNPSGYEVHDPVPAIFEASTVFRFAIPEDAKVLFTVFDTSGQQRYSHTLRDIPAGDYLGASKAFTWNGTDSSGLPLPAGYYIYRFETGSFQQTGAVLKSPIRIRPLQVQDQVFSSFYPPDDFSIYNQPGFRGVTINERLSIVTEGGLMAFLAASDGSQRRKPAMKWFTNVCITALGKSSIARGGVKGAPDGGH
jgi:hypothetical protein